MRNIGGVFEDHPHYDAIVALMACSVKESKENVSRAVKKQLLPLIADICNYTVRDQNRYIDCLRAI